MPIDAGSGPSHPGSATRGVRIRHRKVVAWADKTAHRNACGWVYGHQSRATWPHRIAVSMPLCGGMMKRAHTEIQAGFRIEPGAAASDSDALWLGVSS